MTPPQIAPPDRVLQLLAQGITTVRTAEATGWPRRQVLKLIGTQRGWLVDPRTDVVTMPGRRGAVKIPAPPPEAPPPPPRTGPSFDVPISEIEPHPRNIRDELGDLTDLTGSIRVYGIIQPLTVRPAPARFGTRYQLIAGHRRFAAAQLAGLDRVPVTVRAAVGLEHSIELMLIENCHRRDLTPMEKAEAFGQLRMLGRNQQQIAERTGFSISTVSHYLTLLDLDDRSQDKVRAGELSAADAVQGVRRARAQARKHKGGHHKHGVTWEPDHFGEGHRLAGRAQKLCDGRGHPMRRRMGGACGECWESVIRVDERRQVEAEDAEDGRR